MLTAHEAEMYTEQLKPFDGLKGIGSPAWLKQHEYIERLNVQVHIPSLAPRSFSMPNETPSFSMSLYSGAHQRINANR